MGLDSFMSGMDMYIKCKDGKTYSATKEGCDAFGGVLETSLNEYGYNQPTLTPQPKSQADCKEGEVFEKVYPKYGGQPVKLKTRCVSCEQKWIEHLQFIEEYGAQIKMMPITKEDFIEKCKGTKIHNPVNPVEKVVDAIKPKTEEEEYRNFIYLIMAGIGVYLILSE